MNMHALGQACSPLAGRPPPLRGLPMYNSRSERTCGAAAQLKELIADQLQEKMGEFEDTGTLSMPEQVKPQAHEDA